MLGGRATDCTYDCTGGGICLTGWLAAAMHASSLPISEHSTLPC